MSVYYGVVKDRVVVLPENVHLAEGLIVEVWLPRRKRSQPVLPEDTFRQKLLEFGLLSEIKRPSSSEPAGDRAPIRVKGKPLSQIIIEERR